MAVIFQSTEMETEKNISVKGKLRKIGNKIEKKIKV